MNTLGWILILVGIVLVRAVLKGRVLYLSEDLSDAFLALVRGDTAELTAVFGRSGDGFTASQGADLSFMQNPEGAGKFDVGNVKPHVQKAADSFGGRFGITTIYGYSSTGSVPNSDHPKGLALDFMTSAKTDAGKKRGDALAAALLAEKGTWGVTYVIWNKKINNGSGWEDYTGPRDHTDHVHASFAPR